MDVTLKIHRYVEGKSWVDTFTVPRSTGLTVLGALTYIKEQQDPTLSFTCSCRSASAARAPCASTATPNSPARY